MKHERSDCNLTVQILHDWDSLWTLHSLGHMLFWRLKICFRLLYLDFEASSLGFRCLKCEPQRLVNVYLDLLVTACKMSLA